MGGGYRHTQPFSDFAATPSSAVRPYLETVDVGVEDVSALDAGHQTHGQLLVVLISDVHGGGDVHGKSIHP